MITAGFIQLRLGEAARIAEICAGEIGAFEIHTGDVSASEVRARENGAAGIGPLKASAVEAGVRAGGVVGRRVRVRGRMVRSAFDLP